MSPRPPLPPLRLGLSVADWQRRIDAIRTQMDPCGLCPHRCAALRLGGERGRCRVGSCALLARAVVHHGEEPVLADQRGVGNLFFAACSLRCIYCQNHQISQRPRARRVGARDRTLLRLVDSDIMQEKAWQVEAGALAQRMLDLRDRGVCAIGLVSATPHLLTVLEALHIATQRGMHLPLIYNSSGFEQAEVLRQLDGVVDIYLPDFKYVTRRIAGRLSAAPGYPEAACAALREMHRQRGALVLNDRQVAIGGVLVRHLVLPGHVSESLGVLKKLRELFGADLSLSLMAQYHPASFAERVSPLDRRLRAQEYRRVLDATQQMDLHLLLTQEREASAHYLPDFERDTHPFESTSPS